MDEIPEGVSSSSLEILIQKKGELLKLPKDFRFHCAICYCESTDPCLYWESNITGIRLFVSEYDRILFVCPVHYGSFPIKYIPDEEILRTLLVIQQ